eukprot:g453.t1
MTHWGSLRQQRKVTRKGASAADVLCGREHRMPLLSGAPLAFQVLAPQEKSQLHAGAYKCLRGLYDAKHIVYSGSRDGRSYESFRTIVLYEHYDDNETASQVQCAACFRLHESGEGDSGGVMEIIALASNERRRGFGQLLVSALVDLAVQPFKCAEMYVAAKKNKENNDFWLACDFERATNDPDRLPVSGFMNFVGTDLYRLAIRPGRAGSHKIVEQSCFSRLERTVYKVQQVMACQREVFDRQVGALLALEEAQSTASASAAVRSETQSADTDVQHTTPDEDVQWHYSGHRWLGLYVQRAFPARGGGIVSSTARVTKWVPAEGDDPALWHLEHEDGDEEDLEEHEVEAALRSS